MRLHIKWATIEVDSQDHCLEIIERIETIFKNDNLYFKWDYEIEDN